MHAVFPIKTQINGFRDCGESLRLFPSIALRIPTVHNLMRD